MSDPAAYDLWWKNAVIYCVDVELYADSDGDGVGDLPGLTGKVDYLAGLGVTCVWLMPFYPTPNKDNGYDISDFYGVDPRLGTLGDLVEFLRAARERGIRVIADLVVNHTSDEHPWFQSARADERSPLRDFYVWADEQPKGPKGVVFPDAEDSNWDYDEVAGKWYLHRFYSHMPDLNIANPRVREEISKVVGYWLELGLSGFRVDAAPFVIELEGTDHDRGEDPHAYLRDLRAFTNRRRGDAILLAEANLPPDDQRRFFGDEGGDEMHMLFNFILNQHVFLAMVRHDPAPIVTALQELPEIPEANQWANFIKNHDELTLDKLTEAEREEVFAALAPDPDMRSFGRGIRRRVPPMLDGDRHRVELLYSLLLTLPGTPVLLYGEEIGLGDDQRVEGRAAVRVAMQWTAGFTTGEAAVPLVTEGPFAPGKVNVADQRRDPESLLNWMERAIRRPGRGGPAAGPRRVRLPVAAPATRGAGLAAASADGRRGRGQRQRGGRLDLLEAQVGHQPLPAVGGQPGQHLLQLGDVPGDDGQQVVHLPGDVVGGGDLRHRPDLVLEGAGGPRVVAGQAGGHIHVQGEPGGGRVDPGRDDPDDPGLLQSPDAVQGRGRGKTGETGQLDVGPVGVALQGGQQPDVNIIKWNGHLTMDYFVVDPQRQRSGRRHARWSHEHRPSYRRGRARRRGPALGHQRALDQARP
jgi:trehalose synthase